MSTFEPLEHRICLSVQGVVASLDEGWNSDGTSLLTSGLGNVNQAITSDTAVQQSPSITVNPNDPSHLVLAYLDYSRSESGYAGIATAVSHDSGISWERNTLRLPLGFEQGASDPIAKFDRDGHVYVSFMAASFEGASNPPILNPGGGKMRALGFEANNGIFVARSDDGGLSWAPPVAVASHDYDGIHKVPFEIYPDMAVDNVSVLPDGQSNPNLGNLYVTWGRYYPAGQFPGEADSTGGSDVMIARSRDSGRTWQLLTQPRVDSDVSDSVLQMTSNTGIDQAPGIGFMNWPRVTVGAQGDVAVADFGGGWFLVNHSFDAGETFFVPPRDTFEGLPFGSGGKLLTAGLSNNSFRTVPTRAIAADPVRPGHLYAAEPLPVFDALGNPVDSADIFFARSEDFGRTWKSVKLPGTTRARSVNDDNGGKRSDGSPQNVAADQFMVRMQVNAKGDLALAWYDTRRDPANHLMDVFAAISTDGGKSFSPNFRVTDQSFDADQGSFTGANGQPTLFIGDTLGLAMTDQYAYVAWTDTRAGNQDIYFNALPLSPPPAPLNDQFEPNDTLSQATNLGSIVTINRPRLALEAGDVDWFRLESASTGTLTVNLRNVVGPEQITLQVLDAAGQQVVGESEILRDAVGQAVGRQVRVPSRSGQAFTIRVASTHSASGYVLEAQSLTEDLGTLVQRELAGELNAEDQTYYLFESAAAGVVAASLTPHETAQGDARIEVLRPGDLEVLAVSEGPSPRLNLTVKSGQRLLLRVSSARLPAAEFRGSYRLRLENLDQYSSPQQSVLRFPAGAGPSQMAIGDFNRDGFIDVAVTNTGSNTVSVMSGNGDGTFSAPRQFSVGAFQTPNPVADDANLYTYRRDILAADFNRDGLLDLVITNYDSADVSVLLGNGDGTFQPQRRFDAAAFPIGVTAADVNRDGKLDLVVIDSPEINIPNKLAVLLGRGDGTFQPQKIQELPNILFLAVVALGDLDKDGILDLVAGGGINDGLDLFRGVGDGSFVFTERVGGSRQAASLAIVDLDGDGNLDVVAPSLSDHNAVTILFGMGDLRFREPIEITDVGQGPLAVKVVDWGNLTTPPDGLLDIVVANSGVIPGPFNAIGPPGIVLLPGLTDDGDKLGFGDPITLAPAEQPLDLEIDDFDGDQTLDIAVVDRDGFFIIFGNPTKLQSNLTRSTARDLGIVVHTVQPTLTILPGHQDAWFRMQVPVESLVGAGDQVIDVSANFAHVMGAGLRMEVTDASGRQRGVGDRVRLVASQGETLFVHIEGLADDQGQVSTGAYTLQIVTLPQLVDVQAPALLPGRDGHPGGPITGLVLSFQGSRLDPRTAENPNNYRVKWLGSDRLAGTADDREFIVGANLPAGRAVIYNPSGNRDISAGRTYPNAVRQTVSLLFSEALPPGTYRVEVAADVQVAAYASDNVDVRNPIAGSLVQGVVSRAGGRIEAGAQRTINGLIPAQGALGSFDPYENGTRFLTQLHSDLGALLDRVLSDLGDRIEENTETLLDQIVARLEPALGPVGERLVSLLVVLLDPVSISLLDPAARSLAYDLQKNTVSNRLANSFVEVGGNVELVILAQPQGIYRLNIGDVPPLARGGWAHLGPNGTIRTVLTEAIRDGERSFRLGIDHIVPAALTPLISFPAVAGPLLAGMSRSGSAAASISAPPIRSSVPTSSLDRPAIAATRTDWLEELASSLPAREQRNQNWDHWLDWAKQLRSRLLRTAQELLKGAALLQTLPWNWLDVSLEELSGTSRRAKSNARVTPSLPRFQIQRLGDQSNPYASVRRSRSVDRSAEPSFTTKPNVLLHRTSDGSDSRKSSIVRAMAPLPEDAGPNANRKQVSREDRPIRHRATDDDRSAPRDETVSR